MFTIDGVTFNHIRVLSCEQTFEILDGENATRVLSGAMKRDIIGTFYNYNLKLKPEYSAEGMQEYSTLWYMCSSPIESHTLVIPFDVSETGATHSTLTYQAYITSGKREMLKYNVDGVDYWKEGSFQFIAMSPTRT